MKKQFISQVFATFYLNTKLGGVNALKLALMIFILSVASLIAQTTKTWIGGATGDWDNGPSWSPSGAPNNTFHAVITDAVVTVDINTAACINLTLNGTSQINFAGSNDVLSINGDFINNAGSNPVTGAGLLRFSGSTSKNIEGNAMTLNRISINKSSAYIYAETNIDITESIVINNTAKFYSLDHVRTKATYNSVTGDWKTAYIQTNGDGTPEGRFFIEQAFAENYKCYHMLGSPVHTDYASTQVHEPYTQNTDYYNDTYCFDSVSSIPDWMVYNEYDYGPNYPSNTCAMYGWCGIDNTFQMQVTQGYLGNFEPDANQVIGWFGVPNTGDIGDGDIPSINLEYTNNSQLLYDGLNLLGNPYPMPLDLQELWDENDAVSGFTGIFYVYQNTGAGYGTQVLFWDATGGTSSTLPSQYIPIGQGFEVQTTVDDIQIQFNYGMRAPLNNVEVIRRQPLQNQIQLLLSGEANPDYFSVSLNENFSNEHIVGEDVMKHDNEKNNFFADYGKYKLAVDKLNFPESEHIVPLNLTIAKEGEYTLNSSLFTIDSELYICWLEDKKMKTAIEVNADFSKTYLFDQGTYENRFYLHIVKRTENIPFITQNREIYAYYDHGNIIVNLPQDFNQSMISVYNTLGSNLIKPFYANGNTTVKIPAASLSEGMYIVNARSDSNELQTKLMIQK
jgi:hypothetical protein